MNMKVFVLTLVLPLIGLAADPSPLGKWNLDQSIAGNQGSMVCTFEQGESGLAGRCESPQLKSAVTGKIDGKTITWTLKSEYQGSPLTLSYSGTFDGEKIKGTVTVPEYSVDGEFAASRAE